MAPHPSSMREQGVEAKTTQHNDHKAERRDREGERDREVKTIITGRPHFIVHAKYKYSCLKWAGLTRS